MSARVILEPCPLLLELRAEAAVDVDVKVVTIRFHHDGDDHDAALRMLNLIELAERGQIHLTAARDGGRRRATTAAARARDIQRAATYYRAGHGDDDGMIACLARRYDCSEKTIRRALKK